MIDTEKYQPARQNMKFVTRSLRSLATKFTNAVPFYTVYKLTRQKMFGLVHI
jgi:hypothetical protein